MTTRATPDGAVADGPETEDDQAPALLADLKSEREEILAWMGERQLYDPSDYFDQGPDLVEILTGHEDELVGRIEAKTTRISHLAIENRRLWTWRLEDLRRRRETLILSDPKVGRGRPDPFKTPAADLSPEGLKALASLDLLIAEAERACAGGLASHIEMFPSSGHGEAESSPSL